MHFCYVFHHALNLSVYVPSAENVEYETLLHKTEAALKNRPSVPDVLGQGALTMRETRKNIFKTSIFFFLQMRKSA